MGRRNPYRQGGLATPPPQLDDDDEPDETEPEPNAGDEDEPDEGDDPPADDDESPAGGGSSSSRRGWRMPKPSKGGATQAGAGYVLGLLVWGWVILPFMQKGPKGVKAVLMAKFLNKAPDGSALP